MSEMNKKLFVIGIVILFLGLAFAPSIHANISTESELVEITTEVCGLPGQKPQTVQLTKEDAEAVDRLVEEIRLKLDNAETKEETIAIFNEAIVELDKYGLLGGLSVEQVLKLITRKHHIKKNNPTDKIVKDLQSDDENFNCFIAGSTYNTRFIHSIIPLVLSEMINSHVNRWLQIFQWMENHLPVIIWLTIEAMYAIFIFLPLAGLYTEVIPVWVILSNYIPFPFGGIILIERDEKDGWMYTNGQNGIIKWEGDFFGNLSINVSNPNLHPHINSPAALGFTGIHLLVPTWKPDIDVVGYYLGFARHVKIKEVE